MSIDFNQLLEFVYEVHGYLSEQDGAEARHLEWQAYFLLNASGYAEYLTEED